MSENADPLNPALFAASAVAPETRALNDKVVALLTGMPEWWDVGAERVREARRRGEGAFPAPVMSERARTRTIEGREGRPIQLRVLAPDNPRGVYLHIHGGGWVLGSAEAHDMMMERIADNTGLACVSVEYRLAPEEGGFDRRDPDISPLYADLKGLCPALFSVGTEDALLDDSLFMHARWIAAGNQAELAIHPGGAHGFTLVGGGLADAAAVRMDDFLRRVTG